MVRMINGITKKIINNYTWLQQLFYIRFFKTISFLIVLICRSIISKPTIFKIVNNQYWYREVGLTLAEPMNFYIFLKVTWLFKKIFFKYENSYQTIDGWKFSIWYEILVETFIYDMIIRMYTYMSCNLSCFKSYIIW